MDQDRADWARARIIAYFSDLKINKTEDLEYTYTVKHLTQLYSNYRACVSVIKKEEEDLLADKEEYINAISDLNNIVDNNISKKEEKELWVNIKQILEKKIQKTDNNVNGNQKNHDSIPQNQ